MGPEKILNLLKSGEVSVRISALQFLIKNPELVIDPVVFPCIKELVKDKDFAVRFWVEKAIAKATLLLPPPEKAVSEPPPAPETEPHAGILHHLEKAKRAPNSAIAIDQIRLAFKKMDRGNIDPMLRYLESCPDVQQISYITKFLGQHFCSESLLPVLVFYLRHDDDRVAANTVEGIESIESPKIIPLLAQMLQHRSNRVRANAARALAKREPAEADKVLSRMLQMRDHPRFAISACHAIKELRARHFLPELAQLVGDPAIGESALATIASISSEGVMSFLNSIPEDRDSAAVKEKILNAIQLSLSEFRRGTPNPWVRIGSPPEGNIHLEIGEKKLFVLPEKISRKEAELLACQNRTSAFGLIAKFLFRPREDQIELTYSETRLEPFWHVHCKTLIDYTRSRRLEIPTDPNVKEIKIGEILCFPENNKATMTLMEHSLAEAQREVFVDAESGGRIDFRKYLSHGKREITDLTALVSPPVIVIPARVKASVIVREMLTELLQPIKADEINYEKILIEALNLYYRPIHAFEFSWKARGKVAVLEIDALTGELVAGKTVKQQFNDYLNTDTLFELGTEAAGMVIPGGEFAMKLARAVLRK